MGCSEKQFPLCSIITTNQPLHPRVWLCLLALLMAESVAITQVSILLGLFGTEPRILEGRPAQTNNNKQSGRGRSKPLRRGDQTDVMTADGVMSRVHGLRRDPRKDRYENISRRCRRHGSRRDPRKDRARRRQQFNSGRSNEYSGSGYGELRGDVLARFHGLVLPRSRGFGDKPSLKGRPVPRWCQGDVLALVEDFIPHQYV
ncbi:hypothetical protein Acr_00g0021720 [Actinidia rufa]|uniref:Uncharacterized protein n=1 Tax=Actinidia rufa TaxID=165716 RepID=A0A7J0DDP6_9ERIC|nr:hypothetical protein Acr_00g0021720 [Actinidia rufa]